MDNERIRRILRRWQDSGEVSREDYDALTAAIDRGEAPGELPALARLLRRDLEQTQEPQAGDGATLRPSASESDIAEPDTGAQASSLGQPDPEFTALVMERVRSTELPRGSSARFGRWTPARTLSGRAIAAAAALMIALGSALLLYRTLHSPVTPPAEAESGVVVQEGEQTVVVRFELVAPEAEKVAVVGDFNAWSPEQDVADRPDDDGVWRFELELRRGRAYTYNFLIDGEIWIPDPTGVESIENDLGTEKSLIHL